MSFEETYALMQQIFQPHRKYGAEMRIGLMKGWICFLCNFLYICMWVFTLFPVKVFALMLV